MRFIDDLRGIGLLLLMTSLTSLFQQSHLLSEAKPSPQTSWSTQFPFTTDIAAPPLSLDEAFLNLTKRLDSSVTGDTCLTVGDDLSLTCSLEEEFLRQNFTARNISFMLTHPLQEVHKAARCFSSPDVQVVNTTAAILIVRNVSLEDSGQFSCFVGEICQEGQGLKGVKLVGFAKKVSIENPPQNVTNFHCVVYNWQSMTCTWTHPVEYVDPSRVNVTSSYSIESSGRYKPCSAQSFTSCLWNEATFSLPFENYLIQVNVTDTCANTSTSKTFTVSPLDSVKPDPVEELTAVEYATDTRCLLLSWKHSKPHRDKVYRIKHQALGCETFQKSVFRVLVENLTSEVMNYVTCGYHPYSHHNFSVECLPADLYSGYWSDPAYLDVWSAMTAPDLGPVTTNGSFTSTKCVDGLRNVTLMWQEVKESARNGIIDGYLVKHKEKYIRNTTADEYSASVELPCNLPSELSIFAHNKAGYSLSPSVLIISARSFSVPSEVTKSFTAEIIKNLGSSEEQLHLSWVVGKDTNNIDYTIFWCQHQLQTCKSKINWRKVPSTQTSSDIQIPSSEAGEYLFGISVMDIQTRMGSEIFWANCLFSRNPLSVPAVQNLKFTSMVESILIIWDEQLCLSQFQVKFTNFTVKWGLTNKYQENNGIDWISNVTIPATESSFVIASLKANMNYSFTVQPMSFNFLGDATLMSAIPLAADTPVSLAGVLGGLASGLFALVVVFLVHRNCRRRKKMIKSLNSSNINQEMYKISSFVMTRQMSMEERHVTTAFTASENQANEDQVIASPQRTVTIHEPGVLSTKKSLKLGKPGMNFPATSTANIDIVNGSPTLKHPSEGSSETFPLVIMSSDYVQQNIFASRSDDANQCELPQANVEIQTKDSKGELHKEIQTFPNLSQDESEDNLKSSLPSNCYIRLMENDDMKEINQSKGDLAYADPGYVHNSANCLPNQTEDLEPDLTNFVKAGASAQSTASTLLSSPSIPVVHHEKMLTGEDTETDTDKKSSVTTVDVKEDNKILKSHLICINCTVSQHSSSKYVCISETLETCIQSPDESSQVSEISSELSNMDNVSSSTHYIAECVAQMFETVELTASTFYTQSGNSDPDSTPGFDYNRLPVNYLQLRELSDPNVDSNEVSLSFNTDYIQL